jgi:dTDP-4-dehydrorhamnose reductase
MPHLLAGRLLANRLLVTGVSGLLGLNLALQASDRHQVTGVLSGGRAAAQPGITPFDTLQADLTRPGQVERVLDAVRPDVVVNCAALTELDACELDPQRAYRLNTQLPRDLAEQTARKGARLVHISTDAVFDGTHGDYSEVDTPNPINVYARTKLDGERAVAEANPDALIARVNFYGWSWQQHRSLAEFFFWNLSAGKTVKGFADVIFTPLLVNDLVEILLRMIDLRLNGLYHAVSREAISKYDFGKLLACHFGFDQDLVQPSSWQEAGLKAPRGRLLSLRSEKLSAALGEQMPGQEPAMRRFAELYHQGVPQSLHSILVEDDRSAVK